MNVTLTCPIPWYMYFSVIHTYSMNMTEGYKNYVCKHVKICKYYLEQKPVLGNFIRIRI